MRQAAEAEWAEEGLELEHDHASATLREIINAAPPCPRYVPYYEAYLRRYGTAFTAVRLGALPLPCTYGGPCLCEEGEGPS